MSTTPGKPAPAPGKSDPGKHKKGKVLLAMSGGVDSSVAAALLLQEGYEVVGVFMRLGSPGEALDEMIPGEEMADACDLSAKGKIRIGKQGCCSINDAADARLVAAKLDIPFYVCNFKKDFGRIINYFVEEYNAGRTPNPCVRCNDWLKFGKLHEYARQIGADFVASGHYARIERLEDGTLALFRGRDHGKDQSYVLFGVPRGELGEMLLPVGGYCKPDIRAMARELDLPVFDKPDSQEICFVPDNDYAGLVKRRSPEAVGVGEILDTSGRAIAEHEGHQHFTIGQRRGIGVAANHPLYVIEKDAATNTITVGEREELFSAGCMADEVNWLDGPSELNASGDNDWFQCTAKIRYNAPPEMARVRRVGERGMEVRFDEPQFAVAPGQAVVCYEGERVLGGGWITAAIQ